MKEYQKPKLRTERVFLDVLMTQSGFTSSSFSQCSLGVEGGGNCDTPDAIFVFAICMADDVDAEVVNSAVLTVKPSESNPGCHNFNFDLSDCEVFLNPPGDACPSGENFAICHIESSFNDLFCSEGPLDCGQGIFGLTSEDEFIPCEQFSK